MQPGPTVRPFPVPCCMEANRLLLPNACPLLQRAVAHGLDKEGEFYLGLGALLQKKRQLLAGQLQEIGFKILPADVSGGGALWRCGCLQPDRRSWQRLILGPCWFARLWEAARQALKVACTLHA